MDTKEAFFESLENSKELSIIINKFFEKEKIGRGLSIRALTYLLIEKWDAPADFLCTYITAASEKIKLAKIKEKYDGL